MPGAGAHVPWAPAAAIRGALTLRKRAPNDMATVAVGLPLPAANFEHGVSRHPVAYRTRVTSRRAHTLPQQWLFLASPLASARCRDATTGHLVLPIPRNSCICNFRGAPGEEYSESSGLSRRHMAVSNAVATLSDEASVPRVLRSSRRSRLTVSGRYEAECGVLCA